jgi:transcriptional regulator with XRE-family HTH domain
VSESVVSNWIRSRNEPSVDDLGRIGRRLNVSVDWLLGLTEKRTLDTSATPEPFVPAGLPPRERKELEEMAARLEGEVARMRKKLKQPR